MTGLTKPSIVSKLMSLWDCGSIWEGCGVILIDRRMGVSRDDEPEVWQLASQGRCGR